MLPLTVTGGTWPADVSYEHVRREKGIRFVPGGPIPDNIRTTAWQFMGQEIPQNYGRLVFGLPLAREAEFDPKNESIHGLVSQQREESERDDQPIENPYEQPSRRAGSSQQREEPADQWEQQRSSSGSSEPPQDEQPSPGQEPPSPVQEQVDLTEDDPMGEEVVDLWEAEDPPDEDYVVEAATRSSISGSNPWVLYEAGIICARYEDGSIKPNFYGEKVITLREWGYLRGPQRVALRRQSIGRADWEKLPWAGHLCYLFTRSWEMGRLRSYYQKTRQYNILRTFLEDGRLTGTDWMRGQGEPPGWEDRFSIEREQWSENWLLYERDQAIQEDLEWLVEAVYQFYQKHLDKLIRENDRMWGDFCKKELDKDGNETGRLELNTYGYDMTDPNVVVPMNKKTVIPDPEAHFSFSTKLMVLAIDLYQNEAPRDFCP